MSLVGKTVLKVRTKERQRKEEKRQQFCKDKVGNFAEAKEHTGKTSYTCLLSKMYVAW